ncbi:MULTISPECIES: Rpn family recombination-promoting nuclease/putative transposase [Synechocystis]|uniref:Rpn family recombination-promoting nuclease/putative transposase n=1 Tax=Synechocystis salina LEGE 00031 TaxID=1828736 RepID=A0ABR9VRS9_9SYNC|nr:MULTISPECIES: Rpn family recombination-promoting nuclease/putative transposase [Synechocystis]MBD2655233.1 Rpn family recombination-promoting nuclease/putative transposase [Synechocystis sp. FACHB-383]MBE9241339.1 Rpn family recombination-promoting nuclease/putative transposase [Synechocystis salina LEGE 00041]MBE9254037.1 Rpn family recombination-promoting nuclease/putative transposase [Synechocystis salina LEGE 00031]
MYDNTCKYLAETYPADFATWLLGKPIALTKLEPRELSSEPIRADSLTFLASQDVILHLEFQTRPDQAIPFRMADYYLRLYRKYPQQRIQQFVVYLLPSQDPLVGQTTFELANLRHEFTVIRLWEQPVDIFLQNPGLMPLAALSQTPDPIQTLRDIAQRIDCIAECRQQRNLTAATEIISGLALDKQVIQRLLRSDIMKESVIYQAILEEGKLEGKVEGLQEGLMEAKKQIALNMLGSGLAKSLIVELTGLSPAEVDTLELSN